MKQAQGVGQRPSSPAGSASTRLFFNGSPSEYSGPQSAKFGLFSAGEPASVFQGSSGVVAGTVVRRWNGKGGGRRWGPRTQVSGAVSSGQVAGPVSGHAESGSGNMQFCGAVTAASGDETDPHDAQFCGALAAPSGTETEFSGALFRGAVASPSGFETELEDVQFDDMVASPSGFETEMKVAQCRGAGAKSGFKTSRSRGSMVASSGPLRCVDPGKDDACHLSRQRKGGLWLVWRMPAKAC